MHNKILTQLHGFTSDHTPVAIATTFYTEQQQEVFTVRGGTWNMMNKCHSKAKSRNGINNNPFDIDESRSQYKKRKKAQFLEIIKFITQTPDNLDFMFLQEVDWAFDTDLKTEFHSLLSNAGWGMVQTAMPEKGEIKQQPLVTLFNTKTLQPKIGTGAFSTDDRYRGFEVEFKHRTEHRLVLTNLHLDYNQDYVQYIDEYQKEKIKQGKFCIMGGDTNHPQNRNSQNMIGNWNYATNIDDLPDGRLTTKEENSDKVKHYDGFFVSPTKDTFAIIKELPGKYFQEVNGRVVVANFDPEQEYPLYALHQTSLGEAWKRNRYKIAEPLNQSKTFVYPMIASLAFAVASTLTLVKALQPALLLVSLNPPLALLVTLSVISLMACLVCAALAIHLYRQMPTSKPIIQDMSKSEALAAAPLALAP